MKIIPVVEGDGETEAVPILLRRLVAQCQRYEIQVGRPIKRPRSHLVKQEGLQTAIRLARLDPSCASILIILDADDDCPKTIAPILNGWAKEFAGNLPCEVVMANSEYEAWFLSSLESLRGLCAISAEASTIVSAENIRGAKERLETFMPKNRGYTEKVDQPALSASFDLKAAYTHARSFRRLVRAFGLIAEGMLGNLQNWPPHDWA